MGSVYRRSGSRFLWIKWRDHLGREHQQSSETENTAEARALLETIVRQECAGAPISSGMSVQQFYEDEWLPQRQRLMPFAWKTDASRLKHHFLPTFGGRCLADLGNDSGEVEVLDWLIGLREHRALRDGTILGSRTVLNTASIVRVFFEDAIERKRIRRNPAAIWRADRHLPTKQDKVAGWRAKAGFGIGEVVVLTTDPRVTEDRRVLYTIRFVGGGLRPSSEANLRWRDLDRTTQPLWRLTASTAFDSQAKVEKPTTKTGVDYVVPVHPVLQRALEAWWSEGWKRFIGRTPTPDDLIVPRQDATQRRVNVSLEQFYADLAALGLPRQRQYESRSTFRNLCLLAGASDFHVDLITHPSPRRASDFYTRLGMQWPAMCRAVEHIPEAAPEAGTFRRYSRGP